MPNLVALISTGVLLTAAIPSMAQDLGSIDSGGRWVPRGTFAISNLRANDIREQSYARAGAEQDRILTFLPGMTILYQAEPSKSREGYVDAITHSGIPVTVPNDELSSGQFSDRGEKDVVVHFEHQGCRELNCDTDTFLVASGSSFEISFEDDERIVLANSADEIDVVYSRETFNDNETRGLLTRHKDRINPRWTIYDGYAASLSTGCGQFRSEGAKIEVAKSDYETDVSTWEINSKNWSLKTIEIMDLGKVLLDKEAGKYIGTLTHEIKNEKDAENSAIDLTVFAYRDSEWNPGNYYKFAGLSQVVKCEKSRFGALSPTYASMADLYFDMNSGDGYVQKFPLRYYSLPSPYTDEQRQKLFNFHNRSFFYSINSSKQYELVFDTLSKTIPYPHAIANIIARLNASCQQKDRKECESLSKIN